MGANLLASKAGELFICKNSLNAVGTIWTQSQFLEWEICTDKTDCVN